MSRFIAVTALALAAAVPATATRADSITLTTVDFSSPIYSPGTGTASFKNYGGTETQSVALGSSALFVPDPQGTASSTAGSGTFNFAGTEQTDVTVNGVTKSFSLAYNFTSTNGPIVNFLGGESVVYNLGTESVTVTSVATSGIRGFRVSVSSPTAPVPEPGTFVLAALGLAGVGMAARRGARG